MEIRPIDLPEVRAEVSAQFLDQSVMASLYAPDWVPSESELRETGEAFAQSVAEAEMYHVAPAMAALAFGAAESLEVFSLQPEDVPAEKGLLFFASEDHLHATFTDGCTVAVHGYIWFAHGKGVSITPLMDPHGPLGVGSRVAVNPAMTLMVDYGDEIGHLRAQEAGSAPQMLADVLSTWLLMQQPLASISEQSPDRAARRRLRRAGSEPGPVRVIELRRTQHSSPGDGSREFHHQWIVRGHWRQQWYPAREVHRPVWIAPHIKGPEGAPLIGGEKVYAWKR